MLNTTSKHFGKCSWVNVFTLRVLVCYLNVLWSLCKIWKKMSRLKTVIMPSSNLSLSFQEWHPVNFFYMLFSSKHTRFQCMLGLPSLITFSKAAVCFFRVKSIVGRYFTTYYDHEIFPHMMQMHCSKLPPVILCWRIWAGLLTCLSQH